MTSDSQPVPPEAVTAAAEAIVDRRMRNVHWSNSGLETHRAALMLDALPDATVALDAAAPAIRAEPESRLRDSYQAIHDLHADREHDERRIAELEHHVAVLEVRHAETDDAVRADERKRWLAAIECPSPCDEDCELRPDGCHEEHDVPSHRAHNPFQCSEIRLAIAAAVTAERERLAGTIGPDRFRQMADWFDTDDEFKVAMFPETWPERAHDLQDDLRKFADLLAGDRD
jgi:hypothetical protein